MSIENNSQSSSTDANSKDVTDVLTPSEDPLRVEATAIVHVDPKDKCDDVPSYIGPYEIEREIGRGAMGVVYEAVHTKLKRNVALKVLPAESTVVPDRRKRFQREMEAVGRLDHANIVRATDAGEYDGVHFLVMEFIEGLDLEKLLWQEQKLDVGSACEVIRQTALGLQHIHEHKLVHRDIKPSNLFLTNEGVVKILDLGIAMLRQTNDAQGQTQVGAMMGTPDFIAPEQIQHTRDVDIRADIYSLGCTFYSLLSGQPPFCGPNYDTHFAKMAAHGRDTPPPLRTLDPSIPAEVAQIVQRMMEKKPSDRYPIPADIADAVVPWADKVRLNRVHARSSKHSSPPRPEGPSRHDRRQPNTPSSGSRRPLVIVAAMSVIAILAAFLFERTDSEKFAKVGVNNMSLTDSQNAAIERPGIQPSNVGVELPVERITKPLKSLEENTRKIRENSDSISDTLKEVGDHTKHMTDVLGEMHQTFQSANRQGALVAEPKTVGEFYHNARLYEQQAKYGLARESYVNLFRLGEEFVDVHERFQQVLKLQEGPGGARSFYRTLPGDSTSAVRQYAVALLHDLPERESLLEDILRENQAFSPAIYALADLYAAKSVGKQSLNEKIKEKQLLERFLELQQQGKVLTYFWEQSQAAAKIQDARQRLKSLQHIDAQIVDKPVSLFFSRHPRAWTLTIHIAEPAKEILYRFGQSDDFSSTGFADRIDPATGRKLPRITQTFSTNAEKCDIQVKYVDIRGIERGPFTIPFDPDREYLKDAKRKLDLRKLSWVKFGRNQRKNQLDFTYLALYTDVIAHVRYGVNQESPETAFQLSNVRQGHRESRFVSIPPTAQFAVVQVVYRDGTTSEVVRFDRPKS